MDAFPVGRRVPVLESGKEVMTPFAGKMDSGIETSERCEIEIGRGPELAQHRVGRIGPRWDGRTVGRFGFGLIEMVEDHQRDDMRGVGQRRSS